MNVHCSTCGRPWSSYYLRHEAIIEMGLNPEETKEWEELPVKERLNDRYRDKFKGRGWEFGQTVINVVRCPCCPQDAEPDQELLATKAALEEFLVADENGLAATFQDYHL